MTAPPVLVSRAHLKQSSGHAAAVFLNSGNANAGTGEPGSQDAEELCAHVAQQLGCAHDQVLICSTGLIGYRLHPGKDRHLTIGVSHNLHPADRGRHEGVQRHQRQDRPSCRRDVAARHVDQATIGRPRRDGRGGVVHVADHHIVAMPHQHQDMHDFRRKPLVDAFQHGVFMCEETVNKKSQALVSERFPKFVHRGHHFTAPAAIPLMM